MLVYPEALDRFSLRTSQGAYVIRNMEIYLRSIGLEINGAPDLWDLEGRYLDSYGVADDLDQVKAYLKVPIEDPDRKFVLSYFEVDKDPDESFQGWRWSHWGTYIGTEIPRAEYLNDEPYIDSVICFNLIEILA